MTSINLSNIKSLNFNVPISKTIFLFSWVGSNIGKKENHYISALELYSSYQNTCIQQALLSQGPFLKK